MTQLVLEIPKQSLLDVLLPLLRQLQIRFTKIEVASKPETELAEAIRVVRLGCDMSTFGDALNFQLEARQDRNLPFRD